MPGLLFVPTWVMIRVYTGLEGTEYVNPPNAEGLVATLGTFTAAQAKEETTMEEFIVLKDHTRLEWCRVYGRRLRALGVGRAQRKTVYARVLGAQLRRP